jgi:hypothetical protein
MTQSRRERFSRDRAGSIDLSRTSQHRSVKGVKNSNLRPAPRNRILDEVARPGIGRVTFSRASTPPGQPGLLTCPQCQALVSPIAKMDPTRKQVVLLCPACRFEVARVERRVGPRVSAGRRQLGG